MTAPPATIFAAPQLNAALQALATEVGGAIAAFDTSTPLTTICFVDAERGVYQADFQTPQRPCGVLLKGLLGFAEHCGRSLSAGHLRAIVVGTGPGSFTGLRVGLATAKGLSLGAQVPLYAASSLRMAAFEAGPGLVLALQDARHGEFFAGLYHIDKLGGVEVLLADCAITPEALTAAVEDICATLHAELGTLKIVGHATESFRGLGRTTMREYRPQAAWGIWQCAEAIKAGRSTDAVSLVPQYLRLSQPERQLLARPSL